MKIRWFGTASVAIETESSKVLIDPFVPLPGSTVKTCLEDYMGYDEILLTHGHIDHILSIPDILEERNKHVRCTLTPAVTLLDKGVSKDQITAISPGDEFDIGDIHVTVFKGKHIRFDAKLIAETVADKRILKFKDNLLMIRKENSICIENGETVHYLIESEGKKIFLLGSLALDEDTSSPEGMDLAVLPYQGNSHIIDLALKAAYILKPKKIFLDHFDDTFPPISNSINTAQFTEETEGLCEAIIPIHKQIYTV